MNTINQLIKFGEIDLWHSKGNNRYFEAVQGQIIGDRLYFGGKRLKKLEFLPLVNKNTIFRFGYVELKDLRD